MVQTTPLAVTSVVKLPMLTDWSPMITSLGDTTTVIPSGAVVVKVSTTGVLLKYTASGTAVVGGIGTVIFGVVETGETPIREGRPIRVRVLVLAVVLPKGIV